MVVGGPFLGCSRRCTVSVVQTCAGWRPARLGFRTLVPKLLLAGSPKRTACRLRQAAHEQPPSLGREKCQMKQRSRTLTLFLNFVFGPSPKYILVTSDRGGRTSGGMTPCLQSKEGVRVWSSWPCPWREGCQIKARQAGDASGAPPCARLGLPAALAFDSGAGKEQGRVRRGEMKCSPAPAASHTRHWWGCLLSEIGNLMFSRARRYSPSEPAACMSACWISSAYCGERRSQNPPGSRATCF